jgi:hypothetical protein
MLGVVPTLLVLLLPVVVGKVDDESVEVLDEPVSVLLLIVGIVVHELVLLTNAAGEVLFNISDAVLAFTY